MYRIIFVTTLLLVLVFSNLQGQNSVLDQYLNEALKSNIALQQKNLSYKKSLAALEEAKARFYPSLSIQARYSVARGGRTFDLPLGDLMNPVYNNLNLVNQASQASIPDYPEVPLFPEIENQQVNFLRETEHETALRMVFPIFNSAILNGHRIQQNVSEADRLSVDIYKRELVKEVKTAYFNYLKAQEAVTLFENTILLVEENLRTTKSLNKYDKVTVDVVYAAEAEVKRVEQQLAEAEKNQSIAQAFFNFLLNRDYEAPIQVDALASKAVSTVSLESAQNSARQGRQEIQQFNYFLAATDGKIRMSKGDYLPQLNLVTDYGFQGTSYSFGAEDDYFLGSVVMSWTLFNKPTKAKVEQAELEKQILQQKKTEVQRQIGLQVINTYHAMNAALKSIELAKSEEASAQKAYKLVEKKFRQGQANLVELTNARTQLTNASQQKIIAQYDYQIRLAEFENASNAY
ncbi:MAG: TolC family protein [Bacteroidota bacterium]